jgi:hypothetical protein
MMGSRAVIYVQTADRACFDLICCIPDGVCRIWRRVWRVVQPRKQMIREQEGVEEGFMHFRQPAAKAPSRRQPCRTLSQFHLIKHGHSSAIRNVGDSRV